MHCCIIPITFFLPAHTQINLSIIMAPLFKCYCVVICVWAVLFNTSREKEERERETKREGERERKRERERERERERDQHFGTVDF